MRGKLARPPHKRGKRQAPRQYLFTIKADMERLIHKYLNKLREQGLAEPSGALFLGLDAGIVSNRPVEGEALTLSRVFGLMNINTLLLAEPAEPYWGIIRQLTSGTPPERIVPMDCEMRTFFHDIPVVREFTPEAIAAALSCRKAAIVLGRGIVTYGVVTPEQAFVSFSSVCFSTFVKYFYDRLVYFEDCAAAGSAPDEAQVRSFQGTAREAEKAGMTGRISVPGLMAGPPRDEDGVIRMLSEAGRAVVECRLVDSFFGNISFVHKDVIYISQTGSSLDELECCVDPVPLDGSSSVGITASSELSAHREIHAKTGDTAILHGHPKFAVILSMHCLKEGCDRDLCHLRCPEDREIGGVPVVPGEIGTGPSGLMHTVPKAMAGHRAVIVYGHGVFTSGRDDFRDPFGRLVSTEEACRYGYFRLIKAALG